MRFRTEIGDVKLSSAKRIKLMTLFKEAWERSYDYDLASQAVIGRMIPGLAMGDDDEEKSFKS
ncbi:MAG: hypothetical protein ACRDF4_08075, partial [Rhabdochlamydiaceae bacterium]